MNDYADLILLLAALVIFGVMVTNVSRAIAMNNLVLTHAEVNYGAVSAAQDVIDHTRWIKYDDLSKSSLEDYFNSIYSKSVYHVEVQFDKTPQNGCPTSNPCKEVDVTVNSDYLSHDVTMRLIKTKYINEDE
jgi:hypothetical protein